jgi:hypothetical protein
MAATPSSGTGGASTAVLLGMNFLKAFPKRVVGLVLLGAGEAGRLIAEVECGRKTKMWDQIALIAGVNQDVNHPEDPIAWEVDVSRDSRGIDLG